MKSLVILAVIAFTAIVMASPVHAATVVEQEQELETEVICEQGSYGQNTKCNAYARGKQNQRVKILGEKTHNMVGASLDTTSLFAAAGIITTGAGIATKKFILK